MATMLATFYDGDHMGECETWWYRLTVRGQSDTVWRAGVLKHRHGHWVD